MRSAIRAAKRHLLSEAPTEFTILAGPCRGLKVLAPLLNNQQLRFGLYERETHRYLRRAASSARWFIDVGAGFGELSLFFSLRAKATPVFAIEPWAPDVLARQLALNEARAITVVTQYVGTKPGQIRLDSFSVPATKGFIKIDVDGAEIDVLESGTELLRLLRTYLLVETHSRELENQCIKFLTAIGYKTSIIDQAWWRAIVPEQRVAHNRWLWAE